MRIGPRVSLTLVTSVVTFLAACSSDSSSSLMGSDPAGAGATDAPTSGGSSAARNDAGASSGGRVSDAGIAEAGAADGAAGDGGAFHKGDPFDDTLVSPTSQMIAAQLSVLEYAATGSPKAIAINADGLGFVRVTGDSQSTVDEAALEGCFVIGGGKPCALLAEGNSFALDADALPSAFFFSLAKPTGLAAVPFVQPSVSGPLVAAYTAASAPKAIAVSLDGAIVTVFTDANETVSSDAEAQRLALERCELTAALVPCTLFATDATVVLDPLHPNTDPKVDYGETTIGTSIPGISASVFANVVPQYQNGLAGGSTGALYISGLGAIATGWSMTAGQGDSTAKASCASAAGDPSACFRYANGNTVTFTTASLDAITDYSLVTHCQAMPRTDCAAHKAIGCTTNGTYYTTHTGSVTLETCTF